MIKRTLKILAALAVTILVLNLPVTTKQGINSNIKIIRIPLYIKIVGFVDRDFWYRHLATELIAGFNNDKDKVFAIFDWVKKNIHQQPPGFDIIDDHIQHIIIRRYGMPDQMADVFTTLCVYSGISAFWDMGYYAKRRILYPLSFVKIEGRWYLFDCYRGKYFETNYEKIETLEKILKQESLFKAEVDSSGYRGIPYNELYYNLEFKREVSVFRTEEQMPLKRFILEIRKALGFTEPDRSFSRFDS